MPLAAATPAEATKTPRFSPRSPWSSRCRVIASAMGLRQVFPVQTNRIVCMPSLAPDTTPPGGS